MSELPKTTRQRQVWFVVLAVVVVTSAAGAILGWQLRQRPAALEPAAAASSATLASDWTTDTTEPLATSPPLTTAKRESGVLWQQTGSESIIGRPFDAPRRWRIVWSFNCKSFKAYGGGNFKLSGDGDFVHVLVQRFAAKASGTQRVTTGGRGRLIIESVCDRWTVKAIAP